MGFIDGVVGSVTTLDTDAGGTTTTALSNVASAWLVGPKADAEPSANRRQLALSSDQADGSCLANCSYPNGECVLGECLCDEYRCFEGRCTRESYPRVEGECYIAEDECTNTTCFEYHCEPGFCSPNSGAECLTGMCSTASGVLPDTPLVFRTLSTV